MMQKISSKYQKGEELLFDNKIVVMFILELMWSRNL